MRLPGIGVVRSVKSGADGASEATDPDTLHATR
jgi:hypothetical protein